MFQMLSLHIFYLLHVPSKWDLTWVTLQWSSMNRYWSAPQSECQHQVYPCQNCLWFYANFPANNWMTFYEWGFFSQSDCWHMSHLFLFAILLMNWANSCESFGAKYFAQIVSCYRQRKLLLIYRKHKMVQFGSSFYCSEVRLYFWIVWVSVLNTCT